MLFAQLKALVSIALCQVFKNSIFDLTRFFYNQGAKVWVYQQQHEKIQRQKGNQGNVAKSVTDWILRAVSNGNKDEFGPGKAGKDLVDKYGTKYLKGIGL